MRRVDRNNLEVPLSTIGDIREQVYALMRKEIIVASPEDDNNIVTFTGYERAIDNLEAFVKQESVRRTYICGGYVFPRDEIYNLAVVVSAIYTISLYVAFAFILYVSCCDEEIPRGLFKCDRLGESTIYAIYHFALGIGVCHRDWFIIGIAAYSIALYAQIRALYRVTKEFIWPAAVLGLLPPVTYFATGILAAVSAVIETILNGCAYQYAILPAACFAVIASAIIVVIYAAKVVRSAQPVVSEGKKMN